MILQDEFKNSGYEDLLLGDTASRYEIDLVDIYDADKKPEELLGLYISHQKDDLFFLLDGDLMNIDVLCDRWDNIIRVFTLLNGKSETVRRFKYNIVQLIIYSGDTPDKNREGNLLISRKIILKGDMTSKKEIIIDDTEMIELPFHMIPIDAVVADEEKMQRLNQLLPREEDIFALMKEKRQKTRKKEGKDVLDKTFEEEQYEKIAGWLRK